MNLTLFHYWRSSSSWRVRWALAYKKIPYKAVHVDILNGENESSEHLKRNPFGYVPALATSRDVLVESLPIIEWIEELHPGPPLLPGGHGERARIRALAEFINAGTQPIQNLSVAEYYSTDAVTQKKWMAHFIARGLSAYESLLGAQSGKFSVLEQLTLADLCLIPQVYNALRQEVDLKPYPKIKKIFDHCMTLESCQQSHPDRYKP
ncbi:MAG: maleylacetoacetate isomerase [Oligoflexia bacterium]|nr:maleylacetoacetate isomerase [Oligoflexia bacterium]